jgi:hypothetical protein
MLTGNHRCKQTADAGQHARPTREGAVMIEAVDLLRRLDAKEAVSGVSFSMQRGGNLWHAGTGRRGENDDNPLANRPDQSERQPCYHCQLR